MTHQHRLNPCESRVGETATSNSGEGDVGQPDPNAALGVLRPRQRDYLLNLALGKSESAIAREMGLAETTLVNYRYQVAWKMGVKPAQLAAYALVQGWRS